MISISPVQSFISEARKTQDLFAGSQILSQLTNEGMQLFEKAEGTVIFPTTNLNKKNDSKPNRFLGEITATEHELKELGQKIEKEIRDKFEDLGKKAVEKAEIEGFNEQFKKQFYNQIKNHLEISWLFEEVIDNNYKETYKNIETHLEAVKNTKGFDNFAETGRKCSIDGRNNALLFGKKKPNLLNSNQKQTSVIIKNSYQLNEKEGLSAISFLKRFYNSEQNFPSTAEIALMYAEKNLSEDLKKDLDSFKEIFTCSMVDYYIKKYKKASEQGSNLENKWIFQKSFDYQLLYQENFEEEVINPTQLEKAKPLFAKINPYFKDKYYAILAFDGDKMGDMLSGKFLKNQETDLKEYQKTISTLLSDFANVAKDFLQKSEYNGQAVYAGGDDFLGFVNLHSLSDVLTKLREEFDKQVNQRLQTENDGVYKLTENFTFSAGIAIAHYKMPLDIVLKTAKDMEHKAKAEQEGNRNAFAIAVLKHSGNRHYTYFKWGENFETLKDINDILESLQGNFSDKWIQNLDIEFSLFVNKETHYTLQKEHTALVESELKRLLGRSCNLTGTEKQTQVNDIYEKTQKLLSDPKGNNYNFKNFIEMLHIVRFIRKELK